MITQTNISKQNISERINRPDDSINNFSEIHRQDINISIWKRCLTDSLKKSTEYVVNQNPNLEFSEVIKSADVKDSLKSVIGPNTEMLPFFEDVSYLSFIFCKIFDQKKIWLRLDGIDHPMCPRFHTDNVKCRLVTTYVGPATQWLPHSLVNRSKLGHGNGGKPDEKSGLFSSKMDIEQLNTGHVALLKGESWQGNRGAGLVHRSPHKEGKYRRLYMTIDFLDTYLSIYKNSLEYK